MSTSPTFTSRRDWGLGLVHARKALSMRHVSLDLIPSILRQGSQ